MVLKNICAGLIFVAICYSTILRAQQTGTNIGDIAPEIKLNNPEGEEIALSSLRGKLVLIDFWASWCTPCIKTNSILVKSYKKFKNKIFVSGNGFTIYSISLDKKKLSWTNAINHDNLNWPYHVSSLKLWNCLTTKEYNIDKIPLSILIDGNGTILAKFDSLKDIDKILTSYLKMN